MKIVNRKTFLAMPEGTVYSKYAPQIFGDLCVKGETWDKDFLSQELVDTVESESSDERDEILHEALEKGTEFKTDLWAGCRDGCFEQEQMFAVWDKEDVSLLILRLQEAYAGS